MQVNEVFSKIYYINLDRDIEKEVFFLDQIDRTILRNKCSRFQAVDGKTIDIDTISSDIISDNARNNIISKYQKTYGISLTYGSLGCALSHKKIWEECANDNKPYLIFEDDILPAPRFDHMLIETIKELSNISYDIFLLGYNQIPGFSKAHMNKYIAKPSGLMTGLYAYILSNNGAKKMKHIFPLNKQIDSSISDNAKIFSIYCAASPMCQVSTKFGSKTQKSESCHNTIQKTDPNWNKLFI